MVLLCVIDTETTGLGIFNKGSPRHDDYPVSVGAVVADVDIDHREITCLDSMYSLVRIPDPSRAEDTFFIHGITQEEIERAPMPGEVCERILSMKKIHGFDYAGAWNHQFDKYFMRKLFKLSKVRELPMNWIEMQPRKFAKLDDYVPRIVCDEIKCMPGHNALNDCYRALGVYATLGGFEIKMDMVVEIQKK